MNKQQAIDIVRNTFESPFSRERFANFISRLLNQLEIDPIPLRTGQMIPDAFRAYVSKYERLGKYADDDGHRIDVLIVYLQRESSVERARATQRRFIAGYLQGKYGSSADKDAALVAFVAAEDMDDWRFSLVKLETRLKPTPKGGVKAEDDFTPARRYSFLVGAHEKSHTAQTRLVPIMQETERNPTLAQLEEAFNIEKVTKEFFEKYRDLFIRTKAELDKAVAASPKAQANLAANGVDTVNLAKKLLGQIVFLYYLQKKGWFGVPRDGEWGDGSKQFLRELFSGKHGVYHNFFNDILEPLFYEALRIDRSHDDHYYSRFNCRIPFLNGGLFDPMGGYDWVRADILLANDLFSNQNKTKEGDTGDGILDIFDRYNFTVREDEPLEKEVAIDPELLGKAYEKFNAIRPDNYAEFVQALSSGKKGQESKFNKQYGVYYTPREIVHYMCQQSLIHYLTTALAGAVSQEELTLLIEQGEDWRENDARVTQEGRETRDYPWLAPATVRQHATLIDEKLATITVCDPAVGSGAFPVGMMSEIVRARQTLTTYLPTPDSRTPYAFKRACIEHSLYGVDIDPGAVEIAKLRLWLSLIVEEEDIRQIKPLPNLDYKIVCGNSLIGFPDSYQTMIGQEISDLIHQHLNETNVTRKNELKEAIDAKIESRYANSQRTFGYAVNFDFRTVFAEVFQQNGGFDVVIANPPYVGEKNNKETFDKIRKGNLKNYYQGQMDLFYFFFHLSLNLARQEAVIAFITTNYYPTATGARKLRQDIKNRATIKSLINFSELKLFESALGQHNLITILSKSSNKKALAQAIVTKRNGLATSGILQKILSGADIETDYYNLLQNQLFDGSEYYIRLTGNSFSNGTPLITALNKLKDQGTLLDSICNINVGLYTGADKVSTNYIEKYSLKLKKNEGIFVITKEELENLNFSNLELTKVVPFYKNSDIQRWRTLEIPSLFLINISYPDNKDINFKEYPNIFKHIAKYEKILRNRKSNDNGLRAVIAAGYWWTFTIRQIDFGKPKIVVPQRNKENTFGYNEVPWYASADVYFITEKDTSISLKYVLAVLNSRLYYLWLYHRGKRKGESLELYRQPLSEIPIKKISRSEQKPFIDLVNLILAAKQTNLQADISEWEAEIDRLVYALYGLTPAEIAIVEGRA